MKTQNTVTVNNPTAVAGTTDCDDQGKYFFVKHEVLLRIKALE